MAGEKKFTYGKIIAAGMENGIERLFMLRSLMSFGLRKISRLLKCDVSSKGFLVETPGVLFSDPGENV